MPGKTPFLKKDSLADTFFLKFFRFFCWKKIQKMHLKSTFVFFCFFTFSEKTQIHEKKGKKNWISKKTDSQNFDQKVRIFFEKKTCSYKCRFWNENNFFFFYVQTHQKTKTKSKTFSCSHSDIQTFFQSETFIFSLSQNCLSRNFAKNEKCCQMLPNVAKIKKCC